MISRGCVRRNWSSGKPSLAVAPGLRFCTNTSALASIAASTALSSSRARSSTSDSLPRLSQTKYALSPVLSAFTPVLFRKLTRFRQLVVAAGEVALGPLDLDHARAGIGEAAGAHRRRHRLLERDDEKAGQRKGHGNATRRGFGAVILEHIDGDRRRRTAPGSEFATVPGLRRIAPRCAAPGKQEHASRLAPALLFSCRTATPS